MERRGEVSTNRHCLAHAFHRRGEGRVGIGELFEREPGCLDHHVIERRFERRGGHPRNVIRNFVQPIADSEFRGDLGNRETRCLRRESTRTADARVHLDHNDATVRWVNRELDVTSARVHPDGADNADTDVPQILILAIGQC